MLTFIFGLIFGFVIGLKKDFIITKVKEIIAKIKEKKDETTPK